jgi:hypothetical protein
MVAVATRLDEGLLTRAGDAAGFAALTFGAGIGASATTASVSWTGFADAAGGAAGATGVAVAGAGADAATGAGTVFCRVAR